MKPSRDKQSNTCASNARRPERSRQSWSTRTFIRSAVLSSMSSQTICRISMSICGLIHVKPTDQTRCQKCWPAGPSGLCATGVVEVVGIAIVVFGSALLPGLPVRRFCSTGLGGLPTGLGIGWFEVVRFAGLCIDRFVVCGLLPSCTDDVTVFGIEFNDAGKSSELLRCYQC